MWAMVFSGVWGTPNWSIPLVVGIFSIAVAWFSKGKHPPVGSPGDLLDRVIALEKEQAKLRQAVSRLGKAVGRLSSEYDSGE